MESYQDIKGWFDFEEVYDAVVASAPDAAHFVEVGSCFGKSTAYLGRKILESGKQIRLDAVDLWPSNFDAFFRSMVRCEVNHIVKPMRMPSHLAALHYLDFSLDFVFIDAEHSYEEVCRDIRSWLSKVREGGTLAGHDYHMPGVQRAVERELLGGVDLVGRSWVYKKSWDKVF